MFKKKRKNNLNIADIQTTNFLALNKKKGGGGEGGAVLTFWLLSKNRNWNIWKKEWLEKD